MKIAWKLLVIAGVLLIVIAMSLDTTVPTAMGQVHNIGLQAQQQMVLILGCALLLAGVILFGVLKIKQTPQEEEAEKRKSVEEAQSRKEKAIYAAARTGQAINAGESAIRDFWAKVRPIHILILGAVVVGLTILFPPYLTTDYLDGGIETSWTVRRFVGAANRDEPLLMADLILQLVGEVVVFAVLAFMARKHR